MINKAPRENPVRMIGFRIDKEERRKLRERLIGEGVSIQKVFSAVVSLFQQPDNLTEQEIELRDAIIERSRKV